MSGDHKGIDGPGIGLGGMPGRMAQALGAGGLGEAPGWLPLVALSRRTFMSGLGALTLTACAPGSPFTDGGAHGQGAKGAFALLPLSGSAAAIGQDMARAMSLAASGLTLPEALDAGDTAEAAGEAAKSAMAGHARLILGPLRADQVPGVVALAGPVPVLTFSNDESLAGSGAFIFGVTPAQSVATMFSYAKAQGATRVALVAAETPFGRSSAVAAQAIAAAGGMHLAATLLRDPAKPGVVSALRTASGGVMPEAVFLPDRGAALQSFARGLRGAGVQIMGSTQWGLGADAQALTNPDLDGAWFAAPPPDQFQPFADKFEAAFGTTPGFVAALGYDAALVALDLGRSGAMSRKGLLRAQGFSGALGRFRFQADGRCTRDLSVLGLRNGEITALGEVSGT